MNRSVQRVARSLATACAAASIALLAVGIVPAAAAPRPTLVYDLEFEGDIDCGSFHDTYVDRYHVREVDEFDAAGDLARVIYFAEHSSVDTNSVTGFALEEHGFFHEVDDFVAGTYTITGNQEVANRPGRGVVIQDTGRIVLNADFEAIFFAGGRNHSQWLLGEGIWCDALS
jgi:hypothetical protein